MDQQPADDARRLELQRAEQWMKHLAAGTRLVVIDGAARLEGPPCWLGDTLHTPRQHLAAGDDWVVSTTGWVRLSAERPCSLVCIAPSHASPGGWLKTRLEKLRERLRGWLRISAAADGRPKAHDYSPPDARPARPA
ncbi:hypothetical protein [uncultured Zoogloea sp.]|uniref:hypothetical protein n=1 Tax=uncultured Zoogloea sp. TaxID=160237 RepID=UPI0026136D16|nr:hypothetical protein [uncultured Zoogloea sp.]